MDVEMLLRVVADLSLRQHKSVSRKDVLGETLCGCGVFGHTHLYRWSV